MILCISSQPQGHTDVNAVGCLLVSNPNLFQQSVYSSTVRNQAP